MASASRDSNGDGVRFVHEDDGRVTAIDEETNVASFGDTKAEALRMLAEALDSPKHSNSTRVAASQSPTRTSRSGDSTPTMSPRNRRNFRTF